MAGAAVASQLPPGTGPSWPRRRKTASERRQQATRSEARRLLWACKALASVQTHRGGGLGSFGIAFLHALQGQASRAQPPTVDPGDPTVSASLDVVSPSSEMCADPASDGWHAMGAKTNEVVYPNLLATPFAPSAQEPVEEEVVQSPQIVVPAACTDGVAGMVDHPGEGIRGGGHPHPRGIPPTTPDVLTYKACPRAGASKGVGPLLGAAGHLPFTRTQGGAGSGRGASQDTYDTAFPAIQTWYDPDTWQPTPE